MPTRLNSLTCMVSILPKAYSKACFLGNSLGRPLMKTVTGERALARSRKASGALSVSVCQVEMTRLP